MTLKRIAVMTSGGDAPGMNAFIRAVVRFGLDQGLQVYGIKEGYQGMIENKIVPMDFDSVCNIIHRGGTILKSSRSDEFRSPEGRKKAAQNLNGLGIDALFCCGGEGSYAGLKAFANAEFKGQVLGAPGTIDNDIQGTDYTIGFDTAINTATQAIDNLRDTGEAHNIHFLVEVMGRHCGDIARAVGIASGAVNVLVPETKNNMEDIIHSVRSVGHDITIVAEGDEVGGAMKLADELRKFTESGIDPKSYRVCTLGHIQRGGRPTARDRILAHQMGEFGVQQLIAGQTLKHIASIKDQLVLVDL